MHYKNRSCRPYSANSKDEIQYTSKNVNIDCLKLFPCMHVLSQTSTQTITLLCISPVVLKESHLGNQMVQMCISLVVPKNSTWRIKWYFLELNNKRRFCLHADNGYLHEWNRLGEQFIPQCIYTWPSHPTSGIMVWCAKNWNSSSHLVFAERVMHSIMNVQNIIQSVLLPFLQQKCDVLF